MVHQPPLIVEFPARCCIVRLPLALDLKHFRSFRAARGEARKKTKDPKKRGKRKIVRVSPSFYLQKPPAPGGSIFACCWPLFLLLLFRFSVLVAGERKPGKISEIFSRMRHAYQYHAGEGIIHNYIFPLHVKIKVAIQLVNVFPIMLPSVLMGQFALKTDIKCNLENASL